VTEQTYAAQVIVTDYICNGCGTGKMQPIGILLPTSPPQYRHECTHCKVRQNYKVEYPIVTYECNHKWPINL